jgi:CDP-2,3-bis-(O-geranylgeranyl)-sn-glycerol synthase
MDLLAALYSIIIYPIIYIFPAYTANALPVLLGGGAPLDFGKTLDGRRIFGQNKTIRGLFAGLVGGSLIGPIEYLLFGFGYMIPIAIAMSLGAMFGDLFGSFIKRRFGVKSGSSAPMLDQYGFFFFAMLFAYAANSAELIGLGIAGLLFITILTGALHVLTNIGAYRLKLKRVPW